MTDAQKVSVLRILYELRAEQDGKVLSEFVIKKEEEKCAG